MSKQYPVREMQSPLLRSESIRKYTLVALAVWALAIGSSLLFNLAEIEREQKEIALTQAKSDFETTLLYRRWNAMHGGVFGKVSEITPPNPYLDEAGREIMGPDGELLTRINPAYMTRQVHEMSSETFGIRGHMTSLKPLNPANTPDNWERNALLMFEQGEIEFAEVVDFRGGEYMRFIRPLKVEQSCLPCHRQQGYEVGQVRGGLSVMVPMEPIREVALPQHRLLVQGHGFWFLLGLAGILFTGRRMTRQSLREEDYLRRLEDANKNLQESIKVASEARKDAEKAATVRETFIANFSHEIRTPMNSIMGFAEVLHNDTKDPENKRNSRIIIDSCEHLLNLINDILDISKIESGALTLERRLFDPSSAIRTAVQLFQHEAEKKGIGLRLHFDSDLPDHLIGDSGRFKQIIINLVGNAVKFTTKGSVTINARCGSMSALEQARAAWTQNGAAAQPAQPEGRTPASSETASASPAIPSGPPDVAGGNTLEECVVCIDIKDTGIGIAEDVLPQLFRSFQQADPSITRKYGGTGLGLAISGRLVSLMDGAVQLESVLGQGTNFTVIIPFPRAADAVGQLIDLDNSQPADHAAAPQENDTSLDHSIDRANGPGSQAHAVSRMPELVNGEEHPGPQAVPEGSGVLKKLRVLVVDDFPANLEIARTQLQTLGCEAETASCGREAIRLATERQYDFILMDIQMPDMDGFEATRILKRSFERKAGAKGAKDLAKACCPPIMGFSAHIQHIDEARGLNAGMLGLLHKPLRIAELAEKLRPFVSTPQNEEAPRNS